MSTYVESGTPKGNYFTGPGHTGKEKSDVEGSWKDTLVIT